MDYNSNQISYSFNLSGLTGTGKYTFPGQRAEVYPFQSILPGIGGKFKRVLEVNFGCTTLNSKLTNQLNKYKKVAYSESSNTFSISVRLPDTCTTSQGQSNPLCFNYQYRSTDTPVNMSLGVIFGNTPGDNWFNSAVGSWYCFPPFETYGDCMVCSNSKYDDNLLDGLSPSVMWYSTYYSYACEREDVPDNEFVDGMTNFEYRQEICGNAPKPDNTNIQIKGFEDISTVPYYFGCNIFASIRYVNKMRNSLTTKSMPGM